MRGHLIRTFHTNQGKSVSDGHSTTITAVSNESFEHAIDLGLSQANDVLKHIEGAWITDMKVIEIDERSSEYHISMTLTFVKNVKSDTI